MKINNVKFKSTWKTGFLFLKSVVFLGTGIYHLSYPLAISCGHMTKSVQTESKKTGCLSSVVTTTKLPGQAVPSALSLPESLGTGGGGPLSHCLLL